MRTLILWSALAVLLALSGCTGREDKTFDPTQAVDGFAFVQGQIKDSAQPQPHRVSSLPKGQ